MTEPPGAVGAILGRSLLPGRARGELAVLEEPLSFWGGMDADDGRVIDARHPQAGLILAGRVLAMPSGRGSSSSSSVLAEAIRASAAPTAILLGEPDGIVVLGAAVAAELYGKVVPVVLISHDAIAALPHGAEAEVEADEQGAVVRVLGEGPSVR